MRMCAPMLLLQHNIPISFLNLNTMTLYRPCQTTPTHTWAPGTPGDPLAPGGPTRPYMGRADNTAPTPLHHPPLSSTTPTTLPYLQPHPLSPRLPASHHPQKHQMCHLFLWLPLFPGVQCPLGFPGDQLGQRDPSSLVLPQGQ